MEIPGQLQWREPMPVRNALNCLLAGALVACATSVPMAAQSASFSSKATSAPARPVEAASGYNQPPKNILDVMHAPSPPYPVVSPTHDAILLVSWQDYPSISRVATPFLRLAGVRVEPKNHSKHDTPGGYGITPCASNFELVRIADGAQIHVALPAGACPGEPMWAADGKRFAFVNIAPESVELWIGDAKTGEAHRVPGARLNPMFDDAMQWMPDQKTLLVKLVPKGMGAPPPEPIVPIGPSIQETEGQKGQSSTYENRDTLGNKHDEDLFDYYAASQLALIDAATARSRPLESREITNRSIPRRMASTSWSPRSTSPTRMSPLTIASRRKSKFGMYRSARTFLRTPSRRFPWRIAFPSMAFR
jgi:dipeptidyl aminopeptidase/acylaminoacyl peptidase